MSTSDDVEAALAADAATRDGEPDAAPGVMTHWIAVTAWTTADAAGLLLHFRDEGMAPLWVLRGLLHGALRICGEESEG